MEKLGLNDQQWVLLVDAFPKIAVLVGSADGKMDEKEIEWSKKLSRIRTFAGNDELYELYQEVEQIIGERIDTILNEETDPEKRERTIVSQLEMINGILATLPPKIAAMIYDDLKSFAHHIAKTSGGFLRFFSVSREERDLLDLPMLDEFVYEEEE